MNRNVEKAEEDAFSETDFKQFHNESSEVFESIVCILKKKHRTTKMHLQIQMKKIEDFDGTFKIS